MFIRKAMEIPVDMIRTNGNQPRQSFGEQQLIELRDSIREYGILQPLILKRESGGEFLLIAGERRLRAAVMAGLDKVPAIIKEATEEEIELIALVENIQRENLGYIEEAKAYQRLMEKHGINQSLLAEKLGKNQSTISNKIRILSLPEDIQNMLVSNKLTERHARALLKVDDDSERRIIIGKVIKHGFNVRQTEKLVDEYITGKAIRDRERNKIRHISYKLYLNTLRKAFNDMELNEKGATFEQEDEGDNLRITITIPKGIEGMAVVNP
ncbi:MAG: ParB/RepB/Spo0J family partition protein [Anaerovoracaceae bacterium]|nr:ParB/RepB/Spo0J family partition protein [Anaerovoracaceae bacterium]